MKSQDIIGLIASISFVVVMWVVLGKVASIPYEASPIPPAVQFLTSMLYLVVMKTLVGFRFSWEKCECCSKRYGDHNEGTHEEQQERKKLSKLRAEIIGKFESTFDIREGKMLSNVKSSPDVPRPTGSPPPSVRPNLPWKCSACGTIHAAR